MVWVTRVGATTGTDISQVCARHKVFQVGSCLWKVILRTGNLPNEHSRLLNTESSPSTLQYRRVYHRLLQKSEPALRDRFSPEGPKTPAESAVWTICEENGWASWKTRCRSAALVIKAPTTLVSCYVLHPIQPSARRCTFIYPHGPTPSLATASRS